ncbi:MAG: type III-B CRISPR-associated protein Cas10/Cmr2 [Calditrichaeota bacterium]|nr:type III-B CRISPR-associated protein Cas10/Cmr2 [Calditrichota bacterium]
MPIDWENLLISYLHDPPDKALDIRRHKHRAARYLTILLKRTVDADVVHRATRIEDWFASDYERIYLPKAGAHKEYAVDPQNGKLRIVHPLSGTESALSVDNITEDAITCQQKKIELNSVNPQERFLIIWRFLREYLSQINPDISFLPADTRLPDATIWNHLDISSGFRAVQTNRATRYALLAFALSPVQGFIANSRSLRDLWAGSYILSYLTFAAMKPLIDEFGPSVFVYPMLRNNPLLDNYLCKNYQTYKESINQDALNESLKIASIPNKFFALVPGDSSDEWVARIKQAAEDEWQRVASDIHKAINKEFTDLPHSANWSAKWDWQVQNYFDITAIALPTSNINDRDIAQWLDGKDCLSEVFESIHNLQRLQSLIPVADRYTGIDNIPILNNPGLWQAENKLTSRLLDAIRCVRRIPDNSPARLQTDISGMCSIFGVFEQMGPSNLADSARFWKEAAHRQFVKKNERLSALGLIKRNIHKLPGFDFIGSFPDTATIAATLWLNDTGINPDDYWKEGYWSGQWLHWQKIDEEEDQSPGVELFKRIKDQRKKCPVPTYYAVIMLDGDHMGQWIQGEKSPTLRKILDPKLIEYFDKRRNNPTGTDLLNTRKPVSPALHASISEALANFSLYAVPDIVKENKGTLVYAGGDDVLAFLPTEKVIECASALYRTFRGEDSVPPGYYSKGNKKYLMMGKTATASAGIVIAHYKEDLRDVLIEARRAEKRAKNAGRDRFCLSIMRHSGEHSTAIAKWEFAGALSKFIRAFKNGASDRWLYRLRSDVPVLEQFDSVAFISEASRQIAHSGDETTKIQLGDLIRPAWEQFSSDRSSAGSIAEFLTLLQSASFLTRGRD